MVTVLPHQLYRFGLGLTLALNGISILAAEPAPLHEPKPLTGVAVAPVLVPSSEQELIRERYPNRQVKLERHVIQDADGNYVNHGAWTMWDEDGQLMGSGEYVKGQRQGTWVRNYLPGEAEVINGPLGKQFSGPFVSTANFEEDRLVGAWTILDSKGRTVFEWAFKDGKREGKCHWFYPNGEPWREVVYVNGEPHGMFTEWTPDGQVLTSEKYVHGQREVVQIEWYAPNVKQSEAQMLLPKETTELTVDWWAGIHRIKITGKEGEELRHGTWTSWHENGQIAGQGKYVRNEPEGLFTYWHANGQKSLEGNYEHGHRLGRWVWWHENGQKSIQGDFERGDYIGAWAWWEPDGRLRENAVYSEATKADGTAIAKTPLPSDPRKTAPRKDDQPTVAPSETGEPTVAKAAPRELNNTRQAAKPKPIQAR